MTWLIGIAANLLGPKLARFAKPVTIGFLVVAAVLVLWGGWSLLKHSIIKTHDLEQNQKVIENTAAANSNAADERAIDKTRVAEEKKETQDAIDHAKATGANPRAAYYHCIELQQRARKAGSPTPDC